MASEIAAKSPNIESGLLGHAQGNETHTKKINVTNLGEMLAANGAKSCSITRNADDTISTLQLTYEVNGSDTTKTYSFTYSGGLISGYTVA